MRLAVLTLAITLAAAPASAAVYGIYLNPEDVPPISLENSMFDTGASDLGLPVVSLAAFEPRSTVRSLAPVSAFASEIDAGEPFAMMLEPGAFSANAVDFSENAPVLETPIPGAALLFLAGLIGAGFAGVGRKTARR